MLTDEDLTHELGAAFRTATEDLTYTGRTRPPRTMAIVAPTVVTAATLAAVAIGVAATDGHRATGGRAGVGTRVAPSTHATTKLVTKTIKLAGFTVKYQVAAGAQPPVFAELGIDSIPNDAREIQLTGTEARAWAGTDPVTGDNAVWVKAPTRNDGKVFALLSATWSQDQLIDLLKNGSQVAVVPAVSASPNGQH